MLSFNAFWRSAFMTRRKMANHGETVAPSRSSLFASKNRGNPQGMDCTVRTLKIYSTCVGSASKLTTARTGRQSFPKFRKENGAGRTERFLTIVYVFSSVLK